MFHQIYCWFFLNVLFFLLLLPFIEAQTNSWNYYSCVTMSSVSCKNRNELTAFTVKHETWKDHGNVKNPWTITFYKQNITFAYSCSFHLLHQTNLKALITNKQRNILPLQTIKSILWYKMIQKRNSSLEVHQTLSFDLGNSLKSSLAYATAPRSFTPRTY